MEILYESPNAQANLGQVYLAQNRRDEARAVFEAAAGQEWDKFAVSEASYFLGLMAMEDGDRDEAQAHFTKGANEEADNTGTHRQLCREKLASDFS
jgi:predicted negative regulator of RcsB-dependent stress response